MKHISAFLVLVTALISAAPAHLQPHWPPQTAEIDIHLELNSKDVTGSFKEGETKPDLNYNAIPIGRSLGFPFRLKGHLKYGILPFPEEPPPPYYQFRRGSLLEQGILSRLPTTFKLEQGKLLVGDREVGLLRPFEKGPAPAILVRKGRGLSFTFDREIGGERLLVLRIVEPRFCEPKLIFQGDSFLSGPGSLANIDIEPRK